MSTIFVDNPRSYQRILITFLESWDILDISLATNHSILVLIWFTIHIQEFLKESLPKSNRLLLVAHPASPKII